MNDNKVFKRPFARPVLFFSKCLGFEACRYDGTVVNCDFVQQLLPFVDAMVFCPEQAAGMGVPRKPIRLVQAGEDSVRVFQPATGMDWTEVLETGCMEFLSGLAFVDGAVFKHRSPSCGLQGVKLYKDYAWKQMPQPGQGVFSTLFRQEFPEAFCEDEGRLRNFSIREHFFTAIFTMAAFREVAAKQSAAALTEFHAVNKYLFLGYNETLMREMGRIAANSANSPVPDILQQYHSRLVRLLLTPPDSGRWINVLQHAFGGVSDELTPEERQYFLLILEEFRDERIPLSAVTRLLEAWGTRFHKEYLLGQTFLRPYPEPLVQISDSGKGRDS